MIEQEAVDLIKQKLKQGETEESLRDFLSQADYTAVEINEILTKAKETTIEPSFNKTQPVPAEVQPKKKSNLKKIIIIIIVILFGLFLLTIIAPIILVFLFGGYSSPVIPDNMPSIVTLSAIECNGSHIKIINNGETNAVNDANIYTQNNNALIGTAKFTIQNVKTDETHWVPIYDTQGNPTSLNGPIKIAGGFYHEVPITC